MRVTLRLFATLRDRAQTDTVELHLPDAVNVEALIKHVSLEFPVLGPALPNALVAVNHEYAFADDPVRDGDEVALFPPVSGGSTSDTDTWPELLSITSDPLDIQGLLAHITRPETGGVCVFTGAVRGVTSGTGAQPRTDHLVYEAYEPMAEATLRQIAGEIRERFPKVQGIALVQRVGKLNVGDTTVLTACSAAHRDDGIFEAARYGIDRLKQIVPVWKKEVGPDGSLWVEGHYRPTPLDVTGHGTGENDSLAAKFEFQCASCGEKYPYTTTRFRCACGEPFTFARTSAFSRGMIDQQDTTIWRYRHTLLPAGIEPITLGEGWTPLITAEVEGHPIHFKLESTNPTGSFKDRGAAVLLSVLRASEIEAVHDDSSGNAGAALAAYATRAGITARLFIPASASPTKLAQIALYGAMLTAVEGPRSAAAASAEQAAEAGESVYASHIYNPFAVLGYRTIAYEIWEQLGARAPDLVIVPLGHGSQLIGLADGFRDLLRARLIPTLPRLVGVQAEVCAPLWKQWRNKGGQAAEGSTLAEGIRILQPIRRQEVMSAIRDSQGDIVTVNEAEIREGFVQLAHLGISAEPTSAVVWPALVTLLDDVPESATVVAPITGAGYKTPRLHEFIEAEQVIDTPSA